MGFSVFICNGDYCGRVHKLEMASFDVNVYGDC